MQSPQSESTARRLTLDEGLIDNDFKINSEVHEEKEFVIKSVHEPFKEIKTNSKGNIDNDQIGEENIDNNFCEFLTEVEEAEEFDIGIKDKYFGHGEKDDKEVVTLVVGDISKTIVQESRIDENLDFSNSESFEKKVTEEEEELANYFCSRDNTLKVS